jgi:LPXTG-motif cell wall-anchored protein
MLRKMLFSCAIAALVSLATGTAVIAQEPVDQKTFFTFSAPFELPGGKTLPAGKYTFRIVDSPSNRHVVQIMSEDGTELHATILAIPAQRQDPSDEPEVRFMEAAANQPPAIRTWWYPGRTIGHEFIYPREQARKLASGQREGVLTVDSDATSTEQMQTADLTRVDASGSTTAVNTTAATDTTAATTTAAEPGTTTAETQTTPATRPETTATAQSTTAQPRTPATETPERVTEPAPATERTELPRTASVMPLIGLIGLASLAGAALMRRRR